MTAAENPEAGLAAERTALSWRRTSISAMANAVLLTHLAFTTDWPPVAIVALAAAVTLVVVTLVGVRRGGVLHSHRRGDWADGGPAVALVAVAVGGVIVTALGIAIAYLVLHG